MGLDFTNVWNRLEQKHGVQIPQRTRDHHQRLFHFSDNPEDKKDDNADYSERIEILVSSFATLQEDNPIIETDNYISHGKEKPIKYYRQSYENQMRLVNFVIKHSHITLAGLLNGTFETKGYHSWADLTNVWNIKYPDNQLKPTNLKHNYYHAIKSKLIKYTVIKHFISFVMHPDDYLQSTELQDWYKEDRLSLLEKLQTHDPSKDYDYMMQFNDLENDYRFGLISESEFFSDPRYTDIEWLEEITSISQLESIINPISREE